jgi:hypothetical protein
MKFVSTGAVKALALASVTALSAWAQPTTAPTTGDLPCKDEASLVGTDTVVSTPDTKGYLNLFDGTFKGWHQSCATTHSEANRSQGAIFRLGTADGKPVIYSNKRGSGTGGLMMTSRKFTNYEIFFDFWPDYGDDGGLFNRTTWDGNCYQTVLDYIGAGSVGGMWGEGNYLSRDIRPWTYNGETTVGMTGENSWTNITKTLMGPGNGLKLPCPSTGCTQTEYRALWDADGWMQMKVQFYGGVTTASNVHMKSWFKKPSDKMWIPIFQDTTLKKATPAGYIGFQVHKGSRFEGGKGNWYRSIKWKPINETTGLPLPGYEEHDSIPDGLAKTPAVRAPNFKLTASASTLTGTIDMDYSITVRDAVGRSLESFSGKAGAVQHQFAALSRGVLYLNIKSAFGVQTARVVRTSL